MLGLGDKLVAHGIQFDVAQNRPDGVAGDRARVEAGLPEVTTAGTDAAIETLRIVGLGPSHGPRQGGTLPWSSVEFRDSHRFTETLGEFRDGHRFTETLGVPECKGMESAPHFIR
ncbi:MAG: hypothetical protein WBW33_20480 [Bryobacteraceae bacterium]